MSFRDEAAAADLSGTQVVDLVRRLLKQDPSLSTLGMLTPPGSSVESFEPGCYRPADGPEVVNPMDPKELSDAEVPPPTFEKDSWVPPNFGKNLSVPPSFETFAKNSNVRTTLTTTRKGKKNC